MTSSSTSTAVGQQARELLRHYKQLSKFRLSALVVATSAAGFAAGSGEQICWAKLAWTSVGTMGAAAAANTLNQVGTCEGGHLPGRAHLQVCQVDTLASCLHSVGNASTFRHTPATQWYEVQRDALMNRTRNRPLPRGVVTSRHALVFAAVTAVGGVALLYWKVRCLRTQRRTI